MSLNSSYKTINESSDGQQYHKKNMSCKHTKTSNKTPDLQPFLFPSLPSSPTSPREVSAYTCSSRTQPALPSFKSWRAVAQPPPKINLQTRRIKRNSCAAEDAARIEKIYNSASRVVAELLFSQRLHNRNLQKGWGMVGSAERICVRYWELGGGVKLGVCFC